ncbi:MAG: copper homeostasis protein CutC [Saprospiraceae bacterium]|nr:copper homeostasis protein CutC [Lewinella sp.]
MGKKLLEICCDHLHSALAAQAGGADRIELCSALATDGLTPSAGLLKQLKEQLSIPIFVLIRPRPGNFVYSQSEVAVMIADIEQARSLGANGIVSGALTENNEIDLPATRSLIAAAGPLPFTFHKAFDLTPDPVQALDQLIDLGAARVLTSGQADSAVAGKSMLQQLADRAGEQLRILCAGGIRDHNIALLLNLEGIHEFHSAALNRHSDDASGYPTVSEEMVRNMQSELA